MIAQGREGAIINDFPAPRTNEVWAGPTSTHSPRFASGSWRACEREAWSTWTTRAPPRVRTACSARISRRWAARFSATRIQPTRRRCAAPAPHGTPGWRCSSFSMRIPAIRSGLDVQRSAALRLVGESFPFDAETPLVLTVDNHNTVNGIRAQAAARGAAVRYLPLDRDLRVRPFELAPVRNGLFAFPAQSNFSGVQHPLEWVGLAQARGYRVLLDAAAYLPDASLFTAADTSRLHRAFDLQDVRLPNRCRRARRQARRAAGAGQAGVLRAGPSSKCRC